MRLSDYPQVSAMITTKRRIENDLALLDDADQEQLNTIGVDLVWVEFPKAKHFQLFQVDGSPRLWASTSIHQNFGEELRALARKFLEADLRFCHDALQRLGVLLDDV